ncbi:MAG TPA: hypothetical protein VIR30_18400 [Nocardioides sp.]
MSFCKRCGAVLGVGRFCTNCGAPVVQAFETGTLHAESEAEKTNIRLPAVQPDAATGTRFPLFADELPHAGSEGSTAQPPAAHDSVAAGAVFETTLPAQTPYAPTSSFDAASHHDGSPTVAGAGAAPTQHPFVPPVAGSQAAFGAASWQPAPHPAPTSPAPQGGSHREDPGSTSNRRGTKVLWTIPLVLAMVAMLALGIWLGNRGGDDADVRGTAESSSPSASPSPSASQSPSPTAPTESGGPPADLTMQVTATGPEPIKPGVDLAGNPVTYPVENVLDGNPETAYRMPGAAQGSSITLALPSEASVLEVGVINGYAKTDRAGDRTVDWYSKNRRILEVEWIFDDGTTISQKLDETKEMQVLAISDVTSSTVIMKIVKVTGKPTGELAKDVTAISEVQVRGRTAG